VYLYHFWSGWKEGAKAEVSVFVVGCQMSYTSRYAMSQVGVGACSISYGELGHHNLLHVIYLAEFVVIFMMIPGGRNMQYLLGVQ
jgi:hypothetical protein